MPLSRHILTYAGPQKTAMPKNPPKPHQAKPNHTIQPHDTAIPHTKPRHTHMPPPCKGGKCFSPPGLSFLGMGLRFFALAVFLPSGGLLTILSQLHYTAILTSYTIQLYSLDTPYPYTNKLHSYPTLTSSLLPLLYTLSPLLSSTLLSPPAAQIQF